MKSMPGTDIDANALKMKAAKMATKMAAKTRKDSGKYGDAMNTVNRLMAGSHWEAAMKLMEKVMGQTGKVSTSKKSGFHGDDLEKAKYTKRWKGPDGKWRYEYAKPGGDKDKKKKAKPDEHAGKWKTAKHSRWPDVGDVVDVGRGPEKVVKYDTRQMSASGDTEIHAQAGGLSSFSGDSDSVLTAEVVTLRDSKGNTRIVESEGPNSEDWPFDDDHKYIPAGKTKKSGGETVGSMAAMAAMTSPGKRLPIRYRVAAKMLAENADLRNVSWEEAWSEAKSKMSGKTKKSSLSDWSADILAKAGPYIGKRGGKWADPQHKIPWKEKKHAGKKEPKAKQHDKHHARELQLISENSGPDPRAHYASERGSAHQIHQHRKAVEANLVKKIAAGKYDHAQATKLWEHHAKQVSDHGAKHHGSRKADAATRMAAAKEMADDFHDNVKDGYHDDHEALTGVHGKRAKAGGGLSKMARAHISNAAAARDEANFREAVLSNAAAKAKKSHGSLSDWADNALMKASKFSEEIVRACIRQCGHWCVSGCEKLDNASVMAKVPEICDKVIMKLADDNIAELKAVMGNKGKEAIAALVRQEIPAIVSKIQAKRPQAGPSAQDQPDTRMSLMAVNGLYL